MADLHICGTCKRQFNDIEAFIIHKKECGNSPEAVNEMLIESSEETTIPEDPACTLLIECESAIDDNSETIAVVERTSLVKEAAEIAQVSTFTEECADTNEAEEMQTVQVQEMPETEATDFEDASAQYINSEELLATENLSISDVAQVAAQGGAVQTEAATYQTVEQSQELASVPASVGQTTDRHNWPGPYVHKVVVIVPGSQSTSSTSSANQVVQSTSTSLQKPPKTPKKHSCDQQGCSYSTDHMKDLERHQLVHTGGKPYKCFECSKCFSRMDKLKIHKRTHTGQKPYKCELCPYAAVDNSSLRAHLRVHNDSRPYKCQICQYASRNSSQLTVHLRIHTGDAPFQCQSCDAKFKVNSDLRRHMRCHTGEKPYHCPHCDYKCAIKGNLNKHIDINHSERNSMKCPHCDFVTSSNRMFRDHKKQHITGSAFKCVICNHVATSKTSLKVHYGVHTDEKPHKCSFCNFSTRQRGNIRLHVQRKHPEKWRLWWEKSDSKGKGKKGKGKNMASLCAASMLVEAAAQVAATSPKKAERLKAVCQKPFACDICPATFVREDSLKSHKKHHQKLKEAEIREGAALAVLELKNSVIDISPRKESAAPIPVTTSHGPQVGTIQQDFQQGHQQQGHQQQGHQQQGHQQQGQPQQGQQQGHRQVQQMSQTVNDTPSVTHVVVETAPHTAVSHQPPVRVVPPQSGFRQHGHSRSRSRSGHGGHGSHGSHSGHTSHVTRVSNQSANMMAIMQNNENRAVEDNMQNMQISMRRQRTERRNNNTPSTTVSTTTQQNLVSVIRTNQAHSSQNPQVQMTRVTQAISTAQVLPQVVQSVVPAQVISGAQVQPQQVTVPAGIPRPAYMVSSSGLVRMSQESATPHQTLQQNPAHLSEGQRSFQVVLSDNRTVQVIGPNIPANSQIIQHPTQTQLLRQNQTMSQIHQPQTVANVVASLQGGQVIQEIPVQQQTQVVNRPVLAATSQQPVLATSQSVLAASQPVLATSQPVLAPSQPVLVSQPSSGVIVNPQNQIVSQNQPPEGQSHLVTAIINQHLHLVDQRHIVTQSQGQVQTSQADLVTQQGQVVGQGQMMISQGHPVMALQNVGQGHSGGQTVVQGQVQGQMVQGQNMQVVNQGNIVGTTEQVQAASQSNQHVILQVVTGETNADGTPQMKTIQVPLGVLQGLLANNRKDKDSATNKNNETTQAEDETTTPNQNKSCNY